MQLLVSLRAADEVAAALAGGADIIDAKEPAHGSLGPVAPDVLRAISARVPPSVPFSIALGDFTAASAVRDAVAAASRTLRHGPVYLKLGFAGERSPGAVTALVSVALDTADYAPARAVAVPVAYADCDNAGSPPPEDVLGAAVAAGARAFLLDTYKKDGKGLLDRLDLDRLRRLAESARAAGLVVAIAGSLDLEELDLVAGLADVVGVRGAACRGGRTGTLDATLVRRLRARLEARKRAHAAAG
jgi:(5-formylfuran-3-yl)methyl phosphate synthase